MNTHQPLKQIEKRTKKNMKTNTKIFCKYPKITQSMSNLLS
nr:MAG TPA: hypothetical protein [Caudoviricetes sp.]